MLHYVYLFKTMHINEHEHLGPSCECTRFRPTGWFSLAGWWLIQTIKRNIQFHTFVIIIVWPRLLNLSDSAFFKWNCFKRYFLFADITFTFLLLLLKCIWMRLHFKVWFFYCQTWTPSWWAGSQERIESRDLPSWWKEFTHMTSTWYKILRLIGTRGVVVHGQ